MILPILIYGSPILRKKALEIDSSYPDLYKLVADMKETMYKAEGIGLAAPQVGLSIRLIVIDASVLGEDYPECGDMKLTLVNPRIKTFLGENVVIEEGCLSLPGLRGNVSRSEGIEINYFDEDFVEHKAIYHGFAARVIQHEFDHLEGKVFVDLMSSLSRKMVQSKLNSMRKGKVNASYKVRVD